jgi:hypothetical protein
MPWEKRQRGGRYYTRTRCVDGRKIRQYLGRGRWAEAVAAADERRREEQRKERITLKEIQAQMQALDAALDECTAHSRQLMAAELICAGYHRHQRAWRKRRMKG